MMRFPLLVLAPAAALAACSGGGPGSGTPTYADAGTPGPDAAEPSTLEFELETIDGVGQGAPVAGDNATLALLPSGQPSIAYGSIPLGQTKYELWYAERSASGAWTKERAVIPGAAEPAASGQIIGLGHANIGGVPHLAYLGGDGDGLSPFPSDLILATRTGGTWTERTLVDTSGQAPGDCPGTQDTCNFGNVVGSHAALAAHPSGDGFAVAYRDTHGGFARNDLAISDVEIYGEGAFSRHDCLDPVRGGGAFLGLTFSAAGNPVLAYNVENPGGSTPRTGVWAAAFDGATWTLGQVSSAMAASKIAAGRAPDGTLYLAFNHADDVDLVVATSSDGGATWADEVVDSTGYTGLHPGLTFDAAGRAVIAYGYCGRQSDSDCPGLLGPRSVVRVARREGAEWRVYQVDDGQGFGHVGLFNSIVVTGDGKLGIAFVDEANNDLLYAREK